MPDDHRVVVSRGNAPAEFFPVRGFKIHFRGHKDIRAGIQLEPFRTPLLRQVVWHNDQAFAAQPQAFGLHRRRCHRVGLPGPDNVCKQRVAAVKDARHGVALVLPQHDLRRHAVKGNMAAVIRPPAQAIEFFVVQLHKAFTAGRVFKEPVAERLPDGVLLLLRQYRFVFVQNPYFPAGYGVVFCVVHLYRAHIQRRFQNVKSVDALCTICLVCFHIGRRALCLVCDVPLACV